GAGGGAQQVRYGPGVARQQVAVGFLDQRLERFRAGAVAADHLRIARLEHLAVLLAAAAVEHEHAGRDEAGTQQLSPVHRKSLRSAAPKVLAGWPADAFRRSDDLKSAGVRGRLERFDRPCRATSS